MRGYDHKEIEQKWQKRWLESEAHVAKEDTSKEKFYLLVEFPYPSGNLHVGHWYAFSVPDILARYLRMQGKSVLFPIGFDAFGLPAENAAIKRKLNPRKWTYENMEYMRGQLRSMGASFDWSREVVTCDPAYYKWTQWQFLKLFEKGLVYQAATPVNWCPSCKTVLANEQVVAGHCERCQSEVEKRDMVQWNIKITDYADRLVDDLDPLNWPEPIKESQRNWIGRNEGALISFPLVGIEGQEDAKHSVEVFTTRPDTIFGATYMAVSPELAQKWLGVGWKVGSDVVDYISKELKSRAKTREAEPEKTGIFSGIHAINPANKEKIPVWISNYVLGDVGTGALMAVPAHDERDFDFATKFNLPVHRVIERPREFYFNGVSFLQTPRGTYLFQKRSKTAKSYPDSLGLFGGQFDDTDATVRACILRELEEEIELTGIGESIEHVGDREGNTTPGKYGAVFFVANVDSNKLVLHEGEAIEEMTLEEALARPDINRPTIQSIEILQGKRAGRIYTGPGILVRSGQFDGLSSEEAKKKITEFVGGKWTNTYRLRDWVVSRQRYWGVPIPIIHCVKCGPQPVPEKDLPVELPEIEDYLPRNDGKSPLAKARSWVEVICPKCGGKGERETDTFDTFVDSSWYYLRYTDPQNGEAFASQENMDAWMPIDLYSGGSEHTTMHVLYSRFWQKALFDMGLVKDSEPYTRRMNRGLIMGTDGQKMSKSRGNVIDPDEVVARLGADTVRMYLAFIGPYHEVGSYPWSPDGIVGVRRFLERVVALFEKLHLEHDKETEKALHRLIQKVTLDVPALKFNTAIAAFMSFLNVVEKKGLTKEQYEMLLRLLAPFAPHLAEELWEKLEHVESVHAQLWPHADVELLEEDTVTLGVQVNGKRRGEYAVSVGMSEAEIKENVLLLPEVQKWLSGGEIERIIYVRNRLVNVVVKAQRG